MTGTALRLRHRQVVAALALAAATPVLGACGDGGTPGTAGAMAGRSPAAGGAAPIEVTARSFAFGPDRITVKAGDEVAIVLTSKDSLHDFTVDAFSTYVAAEAGETAEGVLRAGEPGRYEFYCSVPGHRQAGMTGVLTVTAP